MFVIARHDFLQRLAEGFCLLVTAFYRYLLVCHPNSNLGPRIYKPMAAVLVLTPIVALVVSSLDIFLYPQRNPLYSYYEDYHVE